MSSRSSGVTKVLFKRLTMSWTILSPTCSSSTIWRAVLLRPPKSLMSVFRSCAAWSSVAANSENRRKYSRSCGTRLSFTRSPS